MTTLWTLQQVAEFLGYPTEYVWELARIGEIPSYQMSKRSYRFSPEKVKAWVESHSKGGEST